MNELLGGNSSGLSKDQEWNNLLGMVSRTREQYIIDRYLKKEQNKPSKYQKDNLVKEFQKKLAKEDPEATKEKLKKIIIKILKEYYSREKEFFTRIVKEGIFTKSDLSKYYFNKGGKPPTELDQVFEKIIFSTHIDKKQNKKIKICATEGCMEETCDDKKILCEPHKGNVYFHPKKTKLNVENKKEMEEYFNTLEKKEQKLTKKQKDNELIRLGYLLGNLSFDDKEVLKEMKNEYKRYKSRLEKEREKEEILSVREKPLWKRVLDAKNYQNEIYKKADEKRTEQYFTNADLKRNMKVKELSRTLDRLKIRPMKDITALRKRLKVIREEEKIEKDKKKIKYLTLDNIVKETTEKNKKKRKASVSSSSSSISSINLSSPRSRTSSTASRFSVSSKASSTGSRNSRSS